MKYLPLILLCCACGAETGADSGVVDGDLGSDAALLDGSSDTDAGTELDAAVPTCEVGTGVDFFESLTENEVVTLTLGPQGGGRYSGYHIWSSIRTHGFSPQRATVHFQIMTAARDEIGRQERTFNLEPNGDDYVAYGVAPWLDDCCLVRNQPLIMRAEITDQNGLSCGDERRVIGGDRCPDPNGADICP